MHEPVGGAPPEPIFSRLFGVDLRSLALFRIVLGSYIVVDLWIRSYNLREHYTDLGWLLREALPEVGLRPWSSSIYHLSGSLEWAAFLFALNTLFGLALVLGYRTRFAGLGCWLLMLSLQERNPMVLDGADMLFRHLCFWSLFLPLGARWSVDAWRNPELARIPTRLAGVASFAMVMQPVLLYEFAAMTKIQPEWLQEGTGVYYALMLDQLVKPLGTFLLGVPSLVWSLNWATLLLEYLGPLLFFSPWLTVPLRSLMLLSFLGLQIGFGQCIRLMFFPWMSSLALVPLLPSEFWDALGARIPFLAEAAPRLPPAGREHLLRLPRAAALACGGLFFYLLLWNIQALPEPLFRFPEWVRKPGLLLRLEQQWYLFAPPWKTDGWYVLEATMLDGSKLDLRSGKPVSFAKPANTYQAFPTHRTWAFYRYLGYASSRKLRARFLAALRRDFPEREKLREVKMIYRMERTLPGYKKAPPVDILLYHELRWGGATQVDLPELGDVQAGPK
jgi:hypothetical protein